MLFLFVSLSKPRLALHELYVLNEGTEGRFLRSGAERGPTSFKAISFCRIMQSKIQFKNMLFLSY